jgi:signal transduction histidine kinase
MFALRRPTAALRRPAGAHRSSRPPRRTVRLRLTALYGCLFLLSGAGLLAITNLLVAHQSTRATFYISRGNGAAQTHIEGVVGGFSSPIGVLPVPLVQGRTVHKQKAGKVRSAPTPSGSAGEAPPELLSAAAGSPRAIKTRTVVTPGQLRAQARQLSTLAGKQHSTEQNHLLGISAIALGIMAVISLALGWLISGRALRPLDEAFEAQRRFVANASHELRTPLAMMRTSLDVAVAKPRRPSSELRVLEHKLREGLDQADRLLESFLTLARAQRGAPAQQSSVSLTELAREAVDDHAAAAAERGIEIRTALAGAAPTLGNETLLRRMIDNVIDNAIRHNEPGGWVSVESEGADAAPGRVRRILRRHAHAHTHATAPGPARVVVENSGGRLRQDEMADLAQPFRRLGAERTSSEDGHGLGLSIVAAVVAAHGGTLELHARPEGGLRVRIELPGGAAPPAGIDGYRTDAALPAGARR